MGWQVNALKTTVETLQQQLSTMTDEQINELEKYPLIGRVNEIGEISKVVERIKR